MAINAPSTDSIGTGVRFTLTGSDVHIVREDIIVASEDDIAIAAESADNTVEVDGRVLSDGTGTAAIAIGANATDGSGSHLLVSGTGRITATDGLGAVLSGAQITVANEGTIFGEGGGIALTGTGALVTNDGAVTTGTGSAVAAISVTGSIAATDGIVSNRGSLTASGDGILASVHQIDSGGSIVAGEDGIDSGATGAAVSHSGTISAGGSGIAFVEGSNIVNTGEIAATIGIEATGADNAEIHNSGEITGTQSGIAITGGSDTVRVTNDGTVTGQQADGILVEGLNARILNSGDIFAEEEGVDADGSGSRLYNDGTIESNGSGAFVGGVLENSGTIIARTTGARLSGTGARLSNTGVIQAGLDGVAASHDSVRFTNAASGSISATVNAIEIGEGNNVVVNAGYLEAAAGAAVRGGGSGDRILNTGTMISAGGLGPIQLFAGGHFILNSGEIRALLVGPAVNFFGAASDPSSELVNTGTLSAEVDAIRSRSGEEIVRNSGEIIGNVLLGTGNDSYHGRQGSLDGTLDGEDGNDTLSAGADDDVILGGEGDDLLRGNGGGDSLDGGAGSDTASYVGSASGVAVNLATGSGTGGDASGDTLTGIENLLGSAHADTLTGDNAANTLTGGGGNDVLSGAQGNDVLIGGRGDDLLTGGTGADVLQGGDGVDTVSFAGGTGPVTADLSTGGVAGEAAGDTYSGIENITGTGFNDELRGDGDANLMRGRDGNDILRGRGGDDVLEGGKGLDLLFGQGGADRFLYTGLGQGGDTIVDFAPGTDRIVLDSSAFAALAPGTLLPQNLASGPAPLDPDDYVIYNPGTGELFYDADGDSPDGAAPILLATLSGAPALSAADIEIV